MSQSPRTSVTIGGIPDDLHDDASVRHRINRYAHALLHPTLGTDRTTFIAVDVWLWYAARRAADPLFLNTAESFRVGITRKLFDELRKAKRELGRYARQFDIDEIVPDGRAYRPPRSLTPSEVFDQGETIWHVQQAIARLTPRMQRVIRLHDIEGETAADVAAELGISVTTLRTTRERAMAKLRVLLAEYADGGEKAA